MRHQDSSSDSGRDTFLVVALLVVVGLPVFVFFNIITFGLFIVLALLAAGTFGMAGLNYLLWGKAMIQGTAWEREEMQLNEGVADDDWLSEEPRD